MRCSPPVRMRSSGSGIKWLSRFSAMVCSLMSSGSSVPSFTFCAMCFMASVISHRLLYESAMTRVRPVFSEVCFSQSSMHFLTSGARRSRSPMTLMRTLFFMKVSSTRLVMRSCMMAFTSSGGRFQFSVLKV